MGDAVGLLRIEVSDTGVGISSEGQRKLFGEFVQFNKNELQGGGKRLLALLSHLFPAVCGSFQCRRRLRIRTLDFSSHCANA